MRVNLFDCRLLKLAPDAKPEVVTPLGILTFDAEFDGIVIGDLKPSSAHHLEPGGYLFNWTLDGIVAELLLCRPYIATTAATSPAERPVFVCRWEPGYQWTEGGPDSGEGLDAQTWEDAETLVTVGTLDCEWLAWQTKRGFLPPHWADLLGVSYGGITPDIHNGQIDPVVYLGDGFRVVLPELNSSDTCQVQFVAAWAPNTDEARADASTWYAVDFTPENILAAVTNEN